MKSSRSLFPENTAKKAVLQAENASFDAEAQNGGAGGKPAALRIDRLRVKADRVVCEITLAPHAPRKSSPSLMKALCSAFPDLPTHTCINEKGPTFAAVMDSTPLPHVLEHLAISLQAKTGRFSAHPEMQAAAAKTATAEAAAAPPAAIPPAQTAAPPAAIPPAQTAAPPAWPPLHTNTLTGVTPRTQASSPAKRRAPLYTGTSRWADETHSRAIIEVSYTDDLSALAAFSNAVALLNSLLNRTDELQ